MKTRTPLIFSKLETVESCLSSLVLALEYKKPNFYQKRDGKNGKLFIYKGLNPKLLPLMSFHNT